MAKLLIIGVLCLAVFGQITLAKDLAEAINNNLREQLKGYKSFLEKDDGSHKADLNKLIEISESALKTESADQKQTILNGIQKQFTAEFNKYIMEKLEEYQVDDDIHDAIQFYKSLKEANPQFKDEIEKTVTVLESLSKESDLKQKEDGYLNLDKNFSAEFKKFLKENALPTVNRELQRTSEFLENLLADDDKQYEDEIKALKAQAEAALDDKLSVDDKQMALYKVTNPENPELFAYLQKKFMELN